MLRIDRTPDEFSRYINRLQELAYKLIGHTEEYEMLMEEAKFDGLTYMEALERLILDHAVGVD